MIFFSGTCNNNLIKVQKKIRFYQLNKKKREYNNDGKLSFIVTLWPVAYLHFSDIIQMIVVITKYIPTDTKLKHFYRPYANNSK